MAAVYKAYQPRLDRMGAVRVLSDDWNVYILNIVTGEKTQLTVNSANDGLATISPNGNRAAFVSKRESLTVKKT